MKGKETLSVVKGKEKEVKIQSEKAIELLVENGGKDNYKTDLVIDKNKLNDDGKLTAPIKKGEKLGYITVTPKKGEDYGYINGDPVKVNVVGAESVERQTGSYYQCGRLADSLETFGAVWLPLLKAGFKFRV